MQYQKFVAPFAFLKTWTIWFRWWLWNISDISVLCCF